MRSKTVVAALVLLNVVLLASLCSFNLFSRAARAQAGGPARPSEYIQASGEVQGGNSGVVFTIDTRNGLLSAFTFDGTKIEAMPPVDLTRIFKAAAK